MNSPQALIAAHDVSQFDCGVEALNVYLKQYAYQNHQNGSGRTHVVLEDNRVVAFYTLANGSIERESAPARIKQGLPKHPLIPAILLGRFAVDQSQQGKGLGLALLLDALYKIGSVAEVSGVRAAIVDAKDESAKAFYERYGFTAFPEPNSLRLYMLTKDIRKTLGFNAV